MAFKDKEREKEYKREWVKKNKEKVKIYYTKSNEKRRNSPEKLKRINLRRQEVRLQNRDKVNETNKKWYENNKEKRDQYTREWRINNKEKVNKGLKKSYYKLKNESPIYMLSRNIRSSISKCISRKGHTKTSKTMTILGTDYKTFKEYLEGLWEPWMSWDNYGLYKMDTFNYGWDIDHIIPTSSAKTEEEVLKLNHYTNLKPLCSKVNRDIKKDKV
jgi:hypothetical protein